MRVTLIAAVADDGCIGKGGDLPWRLPGDLARFRAMTMGKPVVMGRRTWDSLPRRPLDGRLNIVVSRRLRTAPPGAVLAGDIASALAAARATGAAEAMVIGGAEIYALAMPAADRLLLTRVATRVEGGDAFFPSVDPALWTLAAEEPGGDATADRPAFSYRTYERHRRGAPADKES